MMINFQKNSITFSSTFSILAFSVMIFFLSACVVATAKEPYYNHEPPGARHLQRIQGLWFLNASNVTGKMEFYWDGNAWGGRVWFDVFRQWEPLTDIIFDPRTGELQFTRPNYGQRYVGALSGDRLAGTFVYEGRTLPWEARRH